jgi:hypothetical protein
LGAAHGVAVAEGSRITTWRWRCRGRVRAVDRGPGPDVGGDRRVVGRADGRVVEGLGSGCEPGPVSESQHGDRRDRSRPAPDSPTPSTSPPHGCSTVNKRDVWRGMEGLPHPFLRVIFSASFRISSSVGGRPGLRAEIGFVLGRAAPATQQVNVRSELMVMRSRPLERGCQARFVDRWDFVEYVQQHQSHLDLLSPPRRLQPRGQRPRHRIIATLPPTLRAPLV